MSRLSFRIEFGPGRRLGPGKVELLEQIHATGSISAAGRALGMSYRRAWLLVSELNHIFRRPLVVTLAGGRQGGGATLSPEGRDVIKRYRRMEREAGRAMATDLRALRRLATRSR